jgi:hypothetical protein
MTSDGQMKSEEYLDAVQPLELVEANGTIYAREDDGTWRYAHTWIRVPGARDLTLTERFKPKLVVAGTGSGQEVERVVVSGEDIAAHPDLLAWCAELGAPVRGPDGQMLEVLVPYELWQEHDRIPGEIVAPEHSDDPAERELAIAERKVREAEQALERATDVRAAVLREHEGLMTREQARAITGLSVGRVQQLVKSALDLEEIDQMILECIRRTPGRNARTVARELQASSGLAITMEGLTRRLNRLDQLGLLVKTRQGRTVNYRLSPRGSEAAKAAVARREGEIET